MKLLMIATPLMDRLEGYLIPISMDRLRTSPPLGTYWLAGIARAAGHEVDVLDLIASGFFDDEAIREKAAWADVIGVSCNTLSWPTARLIIAEIRKVAPDVPVVVGGIHASTYPEHVLRSQPIDYIVQGEGEKPLVALLDMLDGRGDRRDIPGLGWLESDGRMRINPNPGLETVDEITALPDPAYDLLPDGVYETVSVESARGCRFSCTFCSTKMRGSWRGLSATDFVDRLQRYAPYLAKTRNGVFNFVDDLYTLDRPRVSEISTILADRGMQIEATLDARATDLVRDGVIDGIRPILNHMLLGAECGYDEGLRKIRKGCNTAILEQAAERLLDAGISNRAVFSFVVGFPFETRDDVLRTLDFASQLLVKYNVRLYVQWFNTIPGSELWDGIRDEGLVEIADYDHFGFFQNERLFRAGVRLSTREIREISDLIHQINTVLLITQPANDIIQFSRPEWLMGPTMDYPHSTQGFDSLTNP